MADISLRMVAQPKQDRDAMVRELFNNKKSMKLDASYSAH